MGAIYASGDALVDVRARSPADASEDPTPPHREESPPEGLLSVRAALVGVGFVWLAAVSAFGAAGAAVYAVRTDPPYLLVAALAAALAAYAAARAIRTFGYR